MAALGTSSDQGVSESLLTEGQMVRRQLSEARTRRHNVVGWSRKNFGLDRDVGVLSSVSFNLKGRAPARIITAN